MVSYTRELSNWIHERYGIAYVLFDIYLLTAVAAHDVKLLYGSTLVMIWGMGLALRLLDDIMSVETDRRKHPQRTLCRSTNLAAFQQTYLILAISISIVLPLGPTIAWVVLNVLLIASYRTPSSHRVWLILLKYPAIVAILAWRLSLPVLGALIAALYLNEILHDDVWLGRHAKPGTHIFRHAIFIIEGVIFWTLKVS